MPLTPARLYRYAVLGAAALFVGGLLFAALSALRSPTETYPQGYVESLIRAHSRQLAHDRDVDRAASVAVETVYVSRRTEAAKKVAALPTVGIAGDTITFADDSAFAIPHRIALLVMAQRDAIAAQDSALRAADELVQRFRVERAASDSVEASLNQENAALRHEVASLTPGKLSRAWSAVRTPLVFTAGVALGAYVTSRVVR